ncbi:glycosyltransferase [Isoptericola sp. NPDC055881]
MRVLRISHSAVVDAWRERERELRRRGVDVALVSAREWDEAGRRVRLRPREGENVVGLKTWGSHPAVFLYDPRGLWRALAAPHDVLDVHEEPFALATAQVLALAWLQARRRGRSPAPFVVYSAQNLAKRYPPPFRWIETAVLRRAAAVQTCNDEAGRIVRAKGARSLVRTIPLGVDAPSPGPTEAPHRDHGPRSARPVVGYAGRLAPHKGVDVLLAAVAADPGLDLRVAGAGPAEAGLRQRAAAPDLAGRTTFVGSLDGADLARFYRGLDVLAVPSVDTPGWVEQFGRVAVEAMACGTPVVASDSGALPDVVGGAGLLVPPGDADALRRALRQVVDDPALAARLRHDGLARAARCTWTAVAQQLQGVYEAIVGSGPAAATPSATGAAPDREPPEVLVVAYGSPDLLRRALEPLTGKLPLTVVDNSSDARVRELTAMAGGRYLDPGRNGGFAAGVNHGLAHRQHPGRDVLLLNPDAVVSAEGVLGLQRALHAVPGTASVGPAQMDDHGVPARVEWPFPRPVAAWTEALGLDAVGRALGRDVPGTRHGTYVVGSVLLISSAALEEIGGLDEGFFLYAEETDWAYRAALRGWRHRLVPEVVATHVGGATSDDPARRDAWVRASQERYWRKHFGTAGWAVARTGGMVGASLRAVLLRGEPRTAARRRLTLLLRGAPA